jgi:hypothetical protein
MKKNPKNLFGLINVITLNSQLVEWNHVFENCREFKCKLVSKFQFEILNLFQQQFQL